MNSNTSQKNSLYYRVTINGIGIYEAVNSNCPPDDPRKKNKPDGSWLINKGTEFPGGISYWTQKGI